MQRPQGPANDQVRPPFQKKLVEKEYLPKNEEDINSFGDQDEIYFLTNNNMMINVMTQNQKLRIIRRDTRMQ